MNKSAWFIAVICTSLLALVWITTIIVTADEGNIADLWIGVGGTFGIVVVWAVFDLFAMDDPNSHYPE